MISAMPAVVKPISALKRSQRKYARLVIAV